MKKMLAAVIGLVMLFGAIGATAEEAERLAPLYATVGDAMKDAGERPIAGCEADYYAVVTEKDGTYYRSFAAMDERATELQEAIWEADSDQLDAAFAAAEEYDRTLPIEYSEVFTALPMDQAEMEALVGKTIGELREAGFEDRESGTDLGEQDEILIVYVMRYGLFEYSCVVDADFDTYMESQEAGLDGSDLTVSSVRLEGITGEAFMKRFHADGTVEEIPDPFAEYTEVADAVLTFVQGAAEGGETDMEAFAETLKEAHPDLADMIDMYVQMYQAMGAEELAKMMTPAENE